MPTAAGGREAGCYGEMMTRFLGPVVLRAFADDDVTEIYLNPQDGEVRFATHTRGRVESGARLDRHPGALLLTAVAARPRLTLGPDPPRRGAAPPAPACPRS